MINSNWIFLFVFVLQILLDELKQLNVTNRNIQNQEWDNVVFFSMALHRVLSICYYIKIYMALIIEKGTSDLAPKHVYLLLTIDIKSLYTSVKIAGL